ncbi:filamentous hemagglutinin N-terminal domain-containing protein [Leptolyngbya sp. CCY15150]|uniref:two-partner secretion domain-containing protein n=1 Tax=Leptolyngbya sp. CCY15150 TaxID=2767772 RepID=UPI00194DC002|nr:filamentous hemagglutinin N-terminal domain-containing protein [Leptolyngbya sp. CCY15150]
MDSWRDRISFVCLMSTTTLAGLGVLYSPQRAIAQIIPDGTLGAEQSEILDTGGLIGVFGGAQRGINLFHSFQEFNVAQDESVFFVNPAGVDNILSRVTGNNPSNILGNLGVLGDANLFLINPNGIIFAGTTILNIEGSFVATTASGVGFGQQGTFTAVNPQVPEPLLIVNPSAFFFNQIPIGDITVNGAVQTLGSGNLTFLGGNITIENALVRSQGRQINLGSVGETGRVRIGNNEQLRFPNNLQRGDIRVAGALINLGITDESVDIVMTARNIAIENFSFLTVDAVPAPANIDIPPQLSAIILDVADTLRVVSSFIINNSGGVSANARSISLEDGSVMTTTDSSIFPDNRQTITGDITLTASENLFMSSSMVGSLIFNPNTINSGNINVSTPILLMLDGSELSTSILGEGDAGDISIDVSDRAIIRSSRLISSVEENSVGNGGNIEFIAPVLRILDGTQITNNIFGTGNAGDIVLIGDASVLIQGEREDRLFRSSVSSTVGINAVGEGGNIEIRSPLVRIADQAAISASLDGQGNAGNITIVGSNRIILQGSREEDGARSTIVSDTLPGSLGSSGTINLIAPIVQVLDGADISANVAGQGNAGNIIISADRRVTFQGTSQGRLFPSIARSQITSEGVGSGGSINITAPIIEILDGANLSTSTFGNGGAGDIDLTSSNRFVMRQGEIFSSLTEDSRGDGGTIRISSFTVSISSRSQLSSSTAGQGNAGDIQVSSGGRVDLGRGSSIITSVEESGIGAGGNIEINTSILNLLDGGQLNASTSGQGDAGNIVISASDRVRFQGGRIRNNNNFFDSGAATQVQPTGIGQGGNVIITTPSLFITDGASISTGTAGTGSAGNIIISASDRVVFRGLDDEAQVSSSAVSLVTESGVGDGGNIEITSPSLRVLSGAQLTASTFSTGNSGNIIVSASDRVIFRGTATDGVITSSAASAVEEGGVGQGGNIEITAPILHILGGAQLNASTSGVGNAGEIRIVSTSQTHLDGVGAGGFSSGLFGLATTTATGQSGQITVLSPSLIIANGAMINARTDNNQQGGNVRFDVDQVRLQGGGQVISSTSGAGRAGNIFVDANQFQITGRDATFAQRLDDFGTEVVTNEGNGESGLFTNTRPSSSGDGGNITLRLNDLEMNDGAILSARSQGTGTAGQLTVRAQGDVILTDSDLTTSAEQSSGGAIFVSARDIRLFGDSDITTFVQSGQGGGGDITLRGDTIVAFSDSDILAFSVDGSGGNITLDTRAFFGDNYRPATDILTREQIEALDGNDRVDINATGQVRSGDIVTPDTSFIQNSLSNLSETVIDTEGLLANSCIARTTQGNTFLITGGGGLPERPGDLPIATYSTGDVRSIPDGQESSDERLWQPGDPIMEPQGVYQLPDGRLVLSRECA